CTCAAGSVLLVLARGVCANTRTRPVPAAPLPFSSTNQRESSPGAWSINSGWLNVSFANTRVTAIVAPPLLDVLAGATQVVFEGRASSPTTTPGGGGFV